MALDKAAWARVRWPSGDVIRAHHLPRLEEPVLAGSLFKLVAARAALDQGVLSPDARLACPRSVEVRGRRLDCVHPDLGRPLDVVDAVAHSCNHFFVRLAERLDARQLDETLARLARSTLPPYESAPLALRVLGLAGPRLSMRTWLRVVMSASTPAHPGDSHAALLRRAMFLAVEEGSAAALADAGRATLAKTGTAVSDAGQQEGRVVAWRPDVDEAIVVRVAGGAGRDAARVAAAVWEQATAAEEPVVRVGRVRGRPVEEDARAAVEAVGLEAYVASVVAAEGDQGWPATALDALAVAARSYARAPDGRHARDGYDVCDTTHCQVTGVATPWSRAAAARTRGMVLSSGAAPLAMPYSASCPGVLADPTTIWGGPSAVTVTVGTDPSGHDVPSWSGEARADDLLGALRAAGHRGDVLRDLRVVERTRDGLPLRILLDGLEPAEIDATRFRHVVGRRLGWDVIKSHAWEVTRQARGYRFTGRGKGHGAGICLAGAAAAAARGSSLAQVLSLYAPGARLVAEQDRLRLRLPAALTAAAPTLARDARALLVDLRMRLGVSAPRNVDIEVHATREAYQRATGRAWWTAANTRPTSSTDYRIDVALPAGPQAAVQVPATLRHEFVHVLTHPLLAEAPAWVAEGLAATIGRERLSRQTSAKGDPCPDDVAVTSPGSPEAMREAYARSADCVVRALPEGVAGWRRLAF